MKKFMIMLILCISVISIYGEDTVKDIDARLKVIENQMIDLEVQKKMLENERERLEKELTNRVDLVVKNELLNNQLKLDKDTKGKIDANTDGVKDWKNWKKNVLFILGFIGLLSLSGIIGFYKYINKRAKEIADEKLDNFFEEKKEKFLKLIKENEIEALIKRNKKLLIISKDKINEELCKEYSKVTRSIVSDFIVKNEDIIIIDDFDKQFTQNELLSIYEKRNNKFILHYIKTNDSYLYGKDEVSFANNKITFHSHLMNSLKFS